MAQPGLRVAAAGTPGRGLRAAARGDPRATTRSRSTSTRCSTRARAPCAAARSRRSARPRSLRAGTRRHDRGDAAHGRARRSQAAEPLAAEGISAEVIDLRWIRPLDLDDHRGVRRADRPPGRRRGAVARGRLGRHASSADWSPAAHASSRLPVSPGSRMTCSSPSRHRWRTPSCPRRSASPTRPAPPCAPERAARREPAGGASRPRMVGEPVPGDPRASRQPGASAGGTNPWRSQCTRRGRLASL